jgi:hypothetical protein
VPDREAEHRIAAVPIEVRAYPITLDQPGTIIVQSVRCVLHITAHQPGTVVIERIRRVVHSTTVGIGVSDVGRKDEYHCAE